MPLCYGSNQALEQWKRQAPENFNLGLRIVHLPTGVDGAVRRIATAYEVRGMVARVTSYDNATVSSGSVVNEVLLAYDSFGQPTADYQAHAGAVNTATTPACRYGYADGSANTVRP